MKNAPYGTWESIISAELVCKGANLPWETQIDGDCCYWTEQRPAEQGRTVVVKWSPDRGLSTLTPEGYSVRTRIYVYGGSAYCVKGDTLYFVNDKDQSIYLQSPVDSLPKRITTPGVKFAELRPVKNGLIALAETDNETNLLCFVDPATGEQTRLVFGADFYSSPQISHDQKKIAWIEWNHPHMSWDESSLWVADLEGNQVHNKLKVAGEKGESVSQPVWKKSGELGFISDKTGWWNLYEWDGKISTPLCEKETEFGVPQWRFNTTWGYDDDNQQIICAYKVSGGWDLGAIKEGNLSSFHLPFNSYSQIKVEGGKVLLLAGSSTKLFSVYLFEKNELKELCTTTFNLPPEWISIARQVKFPTSSNPLNTAYGFFYPPANPHFYSDGPPPVIVKIHGGPTGAAEVSLRPVIQYWTSRGFALFDVDYTGSTGYGRLYRDALNGQWGIADRDDILNGVRYLVEQGWVDPQRLYISGSSAGGFTLLSALTSEDLFTKAVCYYGISDLEAMAKETHKFEKHYLDQLIAPYPEKRAIYIERSPIHAIDKIKASMLIFQGLEDKVVPPDQSKELHEKLQSRKIPSELVLYENEGHGFRTESTLLDTLKRELQFLQLGV